MSERLKRLDAMEDADLRQHLERQLQRIYDNNSLAVLGLTDEAQTSVIREAFLVAARDYHPHRYARRDAEIRRLVTELFTNLVQAQGEFKGEDLRRAARARRESLSRPHRATTNVVKRSAMGTQEHVPVDEPEEPADDDLYEHTIQTAAVPVPVRAERTNSRRISRQRTTIARRRAMAKRLTDAGRLVAKGSGRYAPKSEPPEPESTLAEGTCAFSPSTTSTHPAINVSDIEQFGRAKELLEQGAWTAASKELEELAERLPRVPELQAARHYAMGKHLQAGGDLDQAAVHFRRAIAVDPGYQEARVALDKTRQRIKSRPTTSRGIFGFGKK